MEKKVLESGKNSSFKILIVEDNALLQLSNEEMLKKLDVFAEFASNGQEALEKYHSNYDLILMDLEMPILDGIKTTSIIRALEKNNQLRRVPIVATTSNHSDPEFQEKCLGVGMNGVYGKLTQSKLDELILEYTS